MGLLLIVAGMAAAAGCLSTMTVYWLGRTLRTPRWVLACSVVVGLLVFCASIVPIFHWLLAATTTTVIGASSDVADQVMACYALPPGTATDFSYRYSCGGVFLVADFQMTETNYLRWMRSRGSEPARITEEPIEVYPVRDYDAGKVLLIEKGWFVQHEEPDNPDNTESFVFDAATGRVYILFTLW